VNNSGSNPIAVAALMRPMIEKTAFIWSVNEAWAMLAAFALLGVLDVLVGERPQEGEPASRTAEARRVKPCTPAPSANDLHLWTSSNPKIKPCLARFTGLCGFQHFDKVAGIDVIDVTVDRNIF
jgi:hypothetical protein